MQNEDGPVSASDQRDKSIVDAVSDFIGASVVAIIVLFMLAALLATCTHPQAML